MTWASKNAKNFDFFKGKMGLTQNLPYNARKFRILSLLVFMHFLISRFYLSIKIRNTRPARRLGEKLEIFFSLFDFLCLCSKFYLAQFTDIFSVKNWETKLDRNWISLYWPPQHFTPSQLQPPANIPYYHPVLTNSPNDRKCHCSLTLTPPPLPHHYLAKLSQRKQLLRVVMKVE